MTRLRTYEELTNGWRALRRRGVRVREVACVGAPRTLLVAETGGPGLPAISLSVPLHVDARAATNWDEAH